MSDSTNKRQCLRPRLPTRGRPGPSANSVVLYTVGTSIKRKEDRQTLQSLLDLFHSDEAQVTYRGDTCRLQDLCIEVNINALRYLHLDGSVLDSGILQWMRSRVASCWLYILALSNEFGLESWTL